MALFSHGLRLKDRWRFTPVRQTATVRPLWSQGSKQVLHAILTGDCLNSLKLRVSGAVGQAFHCGVCRRNHHNLGCKRLSARRPTLTRVMDLEPAAARVRGRGVRVYDHHEASADGLRILCGLKVPQVQKGRNLANGGAFFQRICA